MVNSNTEVEGIDELEFLSSITKGSNTKQLSSINMQTVPIESTTISKHDVEAVNIETTEQANSFKKASGKQRKYALEEFITGHFQQGCKDIIIPEPRNILKLKRQDFGDEQKIVCLEYFS